MRNRAPSRPLYQLKAEFFKSLGQPVRIRVLELLSEREQAVAELLPEVSVSRRPTCLSSSRCCGGPGWSPPRREGSTVYYRITSPQVAELLAVARTILTTVLTGQVELLADLRAPA